MPKKHAAKPAVPVKSAAARDLYLYYCITKENTDAAAIYQALLQAGADAELWDELQILEIVMEGGSMDLERISDFDSDADQEFLRSHQVQSVYAVTLPETLLQDAGRWFQVLTAFGFICSDTEDFMPVIAP